MNVCVSCVTLVGYLSIRVADRSVNGRPRLCSLDVVVFVSAGVFLGDWEKSSAVPPLLLIVDDCF